MRTSFLICAALLATSLAFGQDQPGHPEPGVAAVVNGEVIALDTVVKRGAVPLIQAEQDAYQKKLDVLEELIAEKLIANEASRRGLTPDQLLVMEVNSKVAPVTEGDVAEFYAANASRLNGSEQDVREQIRAAVQADRIRERRQAFVQELKARTLVEIRLQPPQFAPLDVSIAGVPLRGNPDAPVTIVEFADFHCPFCKQVFPTLHQILEKYGSKIKLAFKNLPLDDLHPGVHKVHEAAQCATEQGKFWEYYDAVYSAEPDAEPSRLKQFAKEVGLNSEAFADCLDAEKFRNVVQKDAEEAQRLGIAFTPAFLINGHVLSGAQPLENFIRVIDEQLKSSH